MVLNLNSKIIKSEPKLGLVFAEPKLVPTFVVKKEDILRNFCFWKKIRIGTDFEQKILQLNCSSILDGFQMGENHLIKS